MINKDNIDELISKFLSGEASPEEAMLLEDWKEESEQNLHYFDRSKTIFDAAAGIPQQETNVQEAWNRVAAQTQTGAKIKPLSQKPRYMAVAAAFLVLIGIGFAFMFYFGAEDQELISYKTAGEQKLITLADRSSVTIAPNSGLSYSKDFGKTNRTLHLKGSAYFEVQHSEALPFIVDAGDVYIKDIGTKFDIRMSKDTDTVYVKVDEGIVLLFDSAGSELTIKASEKAVYVKSTKKIQKIEETKQINVLPVLDFANSRLQDVALQLEKNYELRVEIHNRSLYDCRITSHFNNESIETVLTILTETLGLSYEKTPSGYLIKGNKCSN